MVQAGSFDQTTGAVTSGAPFMSLWVNSERVGGDVTIETARKLLVAIGDGVRRFEQATEAGV